LGRNFPINDALLFVIIFNLELCAEYYPTEQSQQERIAAVIAVTRRAGKGMAELIDSTREDPYWPENYTTRRYVGASAHDKDDGPAYHYGTDVYLRHPNRSFADSEAELALAWDKARDNSNLDCERAKNATSDAWNRASKSVNRPLPGD